MQQFFTGFLYILIMVFIIFAAYLTSKWLALQSQGMSQGKYINVLDRVVLGKGKGIVIIKIGQKVYLMAEDVQGISKIADLSDEDLMVVESNMNTSSFKDIINTYLGIQLPNVQEPLENTLNNLSELKSRVSDSLANMIKKHNGKEKACEEENDIV